MINFVTGGRLISVDGLVALIMALTPISDDSVFKPF